MIQGTTTLDPIVKTPRRSQNPSSPARPPAAVAGDILAPAPSTRRARRFAPQPPTHQRIAMLAYEIWDQRGRPQGQELDHWFTAEASLRVQQQSTHPRPSA